MSNWELIEALNEELRAEGKELTEQELNQLEELREETK